MSDSFPPDDELISAYLDGEVTETERAAIESDEHSMALVARLRVVQEAVAAPVEPLDDTDRDRILAAALAASDTSATVTSMAVAKERKRRFGVVGLVEWGSRNRRPLVAVAAAVVAIALAVPLTRNLDLGGDADDSAETAATADEPAEEPAEAALATGEAADVTEAPPVPLEATAEAAAEEPAEEFAEEPAEEPADEPAEEPAAEDGADAGGLEFAPLAFELGEFDSPETLIEQVFAAYAVWREDPLDAFLRAGGADTPLPPSCVDELTTDASFEERYVDQWRDVGVAFVAGDLHEVWLFEDGTVYLAPVDTCRPVTEANFFEG